MDVLDVFDFKKRDFDKSEVNVLLSMLAKDEKEIFDLLKLSDNALTTTQVYDYHIDKIIREDKVLAQKIDKLKEMLKEKNKKPVELKAEFARKNKVSVPTNRTITRVLENLKESGFIVKRKSMNKKAKAYYCLQPELKLIMQKVDEDLSKKTTVKEMMEQIKNIKEFINEQKNRELIN